MNNSNLFSVSITLILICIFFINNAIFIVLSEPDPDNSMDFDNQISSSPCNEPNRVSSGFSINYLATYDEFGVIETDNFYSGNTTVVKCNISNQEGISKIHTTRITIINNINGSILLPYTDMTPLIGNNSDITWLWYQFTFDFPIPTARGTYTIIVKSVSSSSSFQEINSSLPSFQEISSSLQINIINEFPQIRENIKSIIKKEDADPWTMNLSKIKDDLEDKDSDLIWRVENVSKSLLKIVIENDNLTFYLKEDAFGSNHIKLILTDSDNDVNVTWFWVIVEPVNDPPIISPVIPDQYIWEDSKTTFINLSRYGFDIEDSIMGIDLIWSIANVNTSLIKVEILSTQKYQQLKITPIENASGKNLVTLLVEESGGKIYWQDFWIIVNPVNDAPIWKENIELIITKPNNLGILKLSDPKYIYDEDTPLDELSFTIVSKKPEHLDCTIDKSGELDIWVYVNNYIGPGEVKVTVNDGDENNTISTTIKLKIQLARFSVQLLAPANGSIITNQTPTLYWDVNKPDTIEELYFDVYLHQNEIEVIKRSDKARISSNQKEISFSSLYVLYDDVHYYWAVDVKYIDKNNNFECMGQSLEWHRNFRINVNSDNLAPVSNLLKPRANEVIPARTVSLTWLGYDLDGDAPISYELYFGTDRQAVSQHLANAKINLTEPTNSSYTLTGLRDDTVYYWTVIPQVKGQQGECADKVRAFGIDLSNTLPKTILILPMDNISISKAPILYWDYFDPDPLEMLYFDIYLSEDKSQVLNTRIATVKELRHYYLPNLNPGRWYYWTVISNDKFGSGACECGIWGFFINETMINHPPVVILLEPRDAQVKAKPPITLTWSCSDAEDDDLTYTLYFGEDLDSVSNFEKGANYITTTVKSVTITNITEGKTYYWTVIPDDGKVPGLCLNKVWSFKYNTDIDNSAEDDKEIEWIKTLSSTFIIIIMLLIFIKITIGAYRKRRKELEFKRVLDGKSDGHLTPEFKTDILSSSTLRALHGTDPDMDNSTEQKLKHVKAERDLSPIHDESHTSDKKLSGSHGLDKSGPYLKGDYEHSIVKSRYREAGLKADHVKRAIPYAKGSQKDNHILTKKDIKLAQPLQKKILTEKAIKASSLPITRQCPECGSFKVRTYKDDTSKCLECKNRF